MMIYKSIFEIKYACVRNDTAETSVKITFITTLHHMKLICDSDCIDRQPHVALIREIIFFFNKWLAIVFKF
jgi:hypothetical protein